MANAIAGALDVARDSDGNFTDEHGDRWIAVARDKWGHVAVNREDGRAAGVVTDAVVLCSSPDGSTFDVDDDSFLVRDGRWSRLTSTCITLDDEGNPIVVG